jgi:hypothetical protein
MSLVSYNRSNTPIQETAEHQHQRWNTSTRIDHSRSISPATQAYHSNNTDVKRVDEKTGPTENSRGNFKEGLSLNQKGSQTPPISIFHKESALKTSLPKVP